MRCKISPSGDIFYLYTIHDKISKAVKYYVLQNTLHDKYLVWQGVAGDPLHNKILYMVKYFEKPDTRHDKVFPKSQYPHCMDILPCIPLQGISYMTKPSHYKSYTSHTIQHKPIVDKLFFLAFVYFTQKTTHSFVQNQQ